MAWRELEREGRFGAKWKNCWWAWSGRMEDLDGAGACCCVGDVDDVQPVAGR